jgi:hypothetical protein
MLEKAHGYCVELFEIYLHVLADHAVGSVNATVKPL